MVRRLWVLIDLVKNPCNCRTLICSMSRHQHHVGHAMWCHSCRNASLLKDHHNNYLFFKILVHENGEVIQIVLEYDKDFDRLDHDTDMQKLRSVLAVNTLHIEWPNSCLPWSEPGQKRVHLNGNRNAQKDVWLVTKYQTPPTIKQGCQVMWMTTQPSVCNCS